jgi:hypothetical protein
MDRLIPWLQECPDPVTRIAWDNYASIAPSVARQLQIINGDVIKIGNLTIPAFVQPGQADKTISIALGYGRVAGIPAELITGVNVFQLARVENGFRQLNNQSAGIEKTGQFEKFALVQGHQSMEGRPIVRESTLLNGRKIRLPEMKCTRRLNIITQHFTHQGNIKAINGVWLSI